ncbi:class I SAM-dependent DNA methyltransferase [Dyella sp. 7MK23]|uniref:site-specific DNA-methyltransferase (adenine-specific) n=1 Tax=Dyella acidiphila TaxID=2775866 RepID=A0ABR9GFF0_9GAMM|nr:class I SAM-dependent DNA methyltransferase [Dyella acidiphila]
MMITRNEIRRRLSSFSKEWAQASRENADSKLFWARFYECFGVRPESATIYEKAVSKIDGARGFIDSFIPGKLIVEHKSRGQDLARAFQQASDYFLGLKEHERPRYIITSDFGRFILTDLKNDTTHECSLKDLSKHADWFAFLVDERPEQIKEESKIDRKAAYQVSRLHQALLDIRFVGHDLEVFMTRLLFCFFADDTGIFGENGQFLRLIGQTREDGKDLGPLLAELFQVLDSSREIRQATLDEDLKNFEYINGSLFSERTNIPAFNFSLRNELVACAQLDWSSISPAIFGAMFQGILEQQHPEASKRQATRRELGAHYTSERNILRLINPLFMDDLRAELHSPKRAKASLRALYDKLPRLTFLDPACGCGNFLVIAFRELRLLEMEVIAELWGDQRGVLDVSTLCRVNVHQFYGIEIDDAAAHIARVALWITDHQLNLEAAGRFGTTRPTVPLVTSPTIVCSNSLHLDWSSVLPSPDCHYILGNPPFVGAKYMSDSQRADIAPVFRTIENGGLLDYVAAWYVKATTYMLGNTSIRAAFVSTNSVCQGEQAGALWPWLLGKGVHISFAHRTFQWNNEGKGVAAVHCIIVGFGLQDASKKILYTYSDIKGEPTSNLVKNINPYLTDAPDVVLGRRSTPLCHVPKMSVGNKPIDGGLYLFSTEEMHEFVDKEPNAKPYFKRWLGADEFLNGYERWCLWLGDIEPNELHSMPLSMERVASVRAFRMSSKSAPTRKLAETPRRFHVEFMPKDEYLVIPEVSSERRNFIPIGYIGHQTLASNLLRVLPGATLFEFGVLSSSMHNAWMRTVAGRLKSDYRYSVNVVYNNYPWPTSISDTQRQAVISAAESVLIARKNHPNATLAELYNPNSMPNDLMSAHAALDKAVDLTYGYRGSKADSNRVSFLFELYANLVEKNSH